MPLPINDILKYARWFLSHVQELAPLLDLPEKLQQATTIEAKIELAIWVLQIIKPVAADFPTDEEIVTLAEDDVKAQAAAAAVDWAKLLALIPVLIQVYKLLRDGLKTS